MIFEIFYENLIGDDDCAKTCFCKANGFFESLNVFKKNFGELFRVVWKVVRVDSVPAGITLYY